MRKHSGISGKRKVARSLPSPPRFVHIHKYIFSMSHDCTTSNVGEVNAAIVDSKEGVRGCVWGKVGCHNYVSWQHSGQHAKNPDARKWASSSRPDTQPITSITTKKFDIKLNDD